MTQFVFRFVAGALVATLTALLVLRMVGCESNAAPRAVGLSAGGPFAQTVGGSTGVGVPIVEGPFDEVWVIARSHPQASLVSSAGSVASAARAGEVPGTGSLVVLEGSATYPDGAAPVVVPARAFPLERTIVRADLAGPVATVSVAQRFSNPFNEKIEAVYIFPLPHDAAVNDFVLSIGERRIRGVIRDREEARKVYQQARSAGYVASLLEQERANIFQERVANIEPGKTIEVTLQFVNTLTYERDAWEWRFPMVVAPRFNPPYAADPIPALPVGGVAAAGGPGAVRGTPIEYLREGERSGADIDLEVRVNAGAPIRAIESPTHAIDLVERSERTAALRLAARDRIPNRDFVLRYGTAGSAPSHAFVTSGAPRDGAMLLTVLPPVGVGQVSRVPLEVVFILDTSGSMSGKPFDQLMEAVHAALDRLRPEDRFQIATFNNTGRSWGPTMVAGTAESVREAKRWVSGLRAGGGTMMLEGLRTALALPHDEQRVRTLIFITDALLSNEDEILRELHRAAARDRVFALGVGSSVNWALLDGMARVGGGAVAALSVDERATPCMQQFLDRISRPTIHSMQIAFEGGDAREIVPARIADLAPGTPVTIAARYGSSPPSRAVLSGWIEGRPVRIAMDLSNSGANGGAGGGFAARAGSGGGADGPGANEGVTQIWARQRIAELSREAAWSDARACRDEIIRLAKSYNQVSPFTSFVAVDASAVTAGSQGTTVIQPAHMPQGMRYDTTVTPAPPPGGWPAGDASAGALSDGPERQ